MESHLPTSFDVYCEAASALTLFQAGDWQPPHDLSEAVALLVAYRTVPSELSQL